MNDLFINNSARANAACFYSRKWKRNGGGGDYFYSKAVVKKLITDGDKI